MPDTPPVTPKGAFDPQVFLGRPDLGKTIDKYEKNQMIFSQGDIADAVFFIQKGKVKITVLSEHGKEAVVGIWRRGSSSANHASTGRNCAPQPAMRWNSA